jgi:tetratricopeptide (TPR) repeat protein
MLGTEYILVLDADQTLEVDDPHAFDDLRADGYDLAVRYGALTYTLPRLLAANKPWQWLGATHEYLQCSDSVVVQSLPGVRIVEHADSHRRNTGAKIPDDIALLTRDLEVDPLNTRALFYLANTWADAGWPEKALEYYRRRVALGGWSEERWYAQYRIGRCWQALNSWDDAVTAYLAAIQMDPQRAEPYYWMAVGMVKRFRVLPALLYLETACKIPNPTGKLFVETSVYEHELRMLLALVRAQGKP